MISNDLFKVGAKQVVAATMLIRTNDPRHNSNRDSPLGSGHSAIDVTNTMLRVANHHATKLTCALKLTG